MREFQIAGRGGLATEWGVKLDEERLEAARATALAGLLAARGPGGHWEGHLSSSALSTATAITALAIAGRQPSAATPATGPEAQRAVEAGLRWLAQNVNPDGGWGDTVLSLSNISTTTLCWAAFGAVPEADRQYRPIVQGAEGWLGQRAGGTEPARVVSAIVRRYGKDRTFSVPILTMCALAGRLGPGPSAWRWVKSLPFELAACPHQWFAALGLPVVSYALPALIAIGQARHFHCPTRNPLTRLLRHLTRERTLRVLAAIQPESGGFLEATPLTSFVTMSLAGSGQAGHPVTQRGLAFLRAAQRPDGSWPIDTNLATWLTTLAVNALGKHVREDQCLGQEAETVAGWLLGQQFRAEHPYTHAAPGGWAWTDLSGGVPDADDTAGALLALKTLRPVQEHRAAVRLGARWLLDLQNRDGGIPTFCRGWGRLPFDHSSADLTAHALRAWIAWRSDLPGELAGRVDQAIGRALAFLARSQRPGGTWTPLWFGNQHAPEEHNLTYGTSRVLRALAEAQEADATAGAERASQPMESGLGLSAMRTAHERRRGELREPQAREVRGSCNSPLRIVRFMGTEVMIGRAVQWLIEAQNPDGSWGGAPKTPPSIEETALALEALAAFARSVRSSSATVAPAAAGASAPANQPTLAPPGQERAVLALERGLQWLVGQVESGQWKQPAPIGFYFAKLWYFEHLYPLIFTVSALNQVRA